MMVVTGMRAYAERVLAGDAPLDSLGARGRDVAVAEDLQQARAHSRAAMTAE